MRALKCVTVLVGFIGHLTVSAQESDTRSAGSGDFSGIYESAVFVNVAPVREPDVYPFTAEGRRAFESYDPLVAASNQVDDCAAYTMPGILWSNSPMEIVQRDGSIVMRYETGGTVRSIPMDGSPASADQPHSGLGHSVGRREGDVLIIETTHLIDGVIRNNRGYPISREARITERYWREPGENDLQMELLVDDPANYTETFTISRVWVWAPDEQVRPYECISLGPRDEEPDIDELARMLEEL